IAQQWFQGLEDLQLAHYSLAALSALGIHVIHQSGQFGRRPLRFCVDDQILRSRAYLIVQSQYPSLPAIDGLATVPYLTPDTIWDWVAAGNARKHLAIVGDDSTAIVLAQALQRLGLEVTLVTAMSPLLPERIVDTVHWLQATLEADGVRIITGAEVQRLDSSGEQILVHLGDRKLTVDAVVVTPWYRPTIESLNLSAVGVRFRQMQICSNARMQTANPRIYTCSGEHTLTQGLHEAAIAVQNALLLPIHRTTYRCIPHIISTDPPLAWVGLTKQQAVARYGHRIHVIQQPVQATSSVNHSGEPRGTCTLVVNSRGHVLGAEVFGTGAVELINTIALAIHQRCPISSWVTLPWVSPSCHDLLRRGAEQWLRDRYSLNTLRGRWLERWHLFRR
ncbi:MAG: FAD-dependent oxidoreductase, partial [Cyanobacteria bacterium]|nr:FAD-dependent oxidoreductase [Cyanobacteriota bacterium]